MESRLAKSTEKMGGREALHKSQQVIVREVSHDKADNGLSEGLTPLREPHLKEPPLRSRPSNKAIPRVSSKGGDK